MKTKTKRILFTLSAILLVLLFVQIYYNDVMSRSWEKERAAVQAARQYGGLGKVEKTYRSVWDENSNYWVASGLDTKGENIMVWVKFTKDGVPAGGDFVHAESLKDGMSEKQMSSLISSQFPEVSMLRLVPGMYENEYVWQLHFRDEGKTGYRFFRFADGEPIGEDIILPNP
ncbi:DUF5590 domain-containing protein [Paenibacillus sp. F411]|uniref:Cell wall elongation regulator TseB-like domain-containing protein n=1 Tax=Paenibacillus algicola TaxID=2565926 RepID=A0A4P8XJ20_9BACL|nr:MULTISPECIES: DUF5590 domain-containing protein [Paenibacillus]MBO2943141.1 DUF5590 domain-containing protein [Paenibacillus sp. F411]QCT02606.1 hypothetical protein E6C60_1891 [Paenibacillus algicola]